MLILTNDKQDTRTTLDVPSCTIMYYNVLNILLPRAILHTKTEKSYLITIGMLWCTLLPSNLFKSNLMSM